MTWFAAIATGISVGLWAQLTFAHRRAVRALRRRWADSPARLSAYPSVTVIRPVKGRDVEQDENLRAALDMGYPGRLETIFVFENEHDPGYPAAHAAIEKHAHAGSPDSARVVFSGEPPPGRTGKIHNMIAGAAEADGEFIAFTDSDSRPDREVLNNLIEHLAADDGAGASFAPVTTPSPPRAPADVGHNIILSAFLVANMEVHLGPHRDLPFLMGQFMVFRQEALRAIGGVECADGQLVDDMYLGARVVDAGHRNVMGTHPLPIIHHGMGFRSFLRLWRRWLFFGRGGIPASFVRPFAVRCVSFYMALGLAIAALLVGPLWAVAPPALLWILEGVHHLQLHRLYGGTRVPLRYAWMAWVPWLMLVPVGASMLVRPELNWRGHVYRVDWEARLDARRTGED